MRTRTIYGMFGGALLGALALTWTGAGNAQEGVTEKVGESLDEAGRAIKRGFQRSTEAVREGFAKTRASVHNMGVESRVYGRLHWDKQLNGSLIELEGRSGGIIVLRGTVPSAEVKVKAVTLAKDTVGVTQVIDQLSLGAPARVVPGTPEGATTTTEKTTTTTTTTESPSNP